MLQRSSKSLVRVFVTWKMVDNLFANPPFMTLLVYFVWRNGSPAGLDGLYIDTSLANAMSLAPKSAMSIQIRSDGFWSLAPPLAWQWPANTDAWTPIVGPHTQAFAYALQTIKHPNTAAPAPPTLPVTFGTTPPPPSLKRSCEASPVPAPHIPPNSAGFTPTYMEGGSGGNRTSDFSPVNCLPPKPTSTSESTSIQWTPG